MVELYTHAKLHVAINIIVFQDVVKMDIIFQALKKMFLSFLSQKIVFHLYIPLIMSFRTKR